jgi:predicted dehydrogenase
MTSDIRVPGSAAGATERPAFNIGVLGAGQIAQAAHFAACRKAATAELYAICDSAEDLLARMTAIHQPRVSYTDYDTMLSDSNIDAVIVAVADQFHVPLAIRALDAGKHVLVEKPMGTCVEEAEELVAAAERNQRVVLVGHEKRYDPGVAFAWDFIQGKIGEIIALKHWYCDSTYRYKITDTLQPIIETSATARRPSGNPKADRQRYLMLAHGSHLLDTARYLGGPLTAVRARLSTKAGTYCWFIEVNFESGCLGQLDLTIAVRMDWWEGFQVYGSAGSVVGKLYNPWYLKAADVQVFLVDDEQFHQPIGADADVFRLQVEDLVRAVATGFAPRGATASDGLASVRGMVAIARSVESGDWVGLADVSGGV